MKAYVFVAVLVLFMPLVEAQFHDSIYEYLKKVDENYVIVVGAHGRSFDSVAASDLVLGLLRANRVSLQTRLDNEVNPNINKIVIGHPCNNKLVKLPCETWPFKAGEAVVKLIGNDLVLAGSDDDATIQAAKVLAKYRDYDGLKKFKYALIRGSDIRGLQENYKLECGNDVCEDGEEYQCPLDCEGITCEQKCNVLGFLQSACVDEVVRVGGQTCADAQLELGKGYCADRRVCCCILDDEPKEAKKLNVTEMPSEPRVVPKAKRYDLGKTLSDNRGAAIIFLLLLVIIAVMIGFYRKMSP